MSSVDAGTLKAWATRGALVVGVISLATLVVAFLEVVVGMPDASAIYLVAVVVSAMAAGTAVALATAVAAILTYDLFFTEPFLTLVITDTSEWLSLVLFSFVGIIVGQLVALQRQRTREALAREREAQDLHAVTRILATRTSTAEALADIAGVLRERTAMERVWFALGADEAAERTVADTGHGPAPAGGMFAQMRRNEKQPEWIQLHAPHRGDGALQPSKMLVRVAIESGAERLGSLWAIRARSAMPVDPTVSRLIAVVADQVGQVIRQDRLASEAADVKIAQESSALKSALVDAVSHDLRTPLVSIRATAGTLMDMEFEPTGVASAAASIDRQAERLDRIVSNLLDLGRIQGSTLKTTSEAVELGELVRRALDRLTDGEALFAEERHVDVRVDDVWVDADPVLLEQAVLNVLENAFRHTPRDAHVQVTAAVLDDGSRIRLSVEDSGAGVPGSALAGLFARSERLRSPLSVARASSGVGLTIVRGFVEAMGGHVAASRSELGGLRVDLDLIATRMPADIVQTGT